MAVSVDELDDTLGLVAQLSLSFPVVADPKRQVVKQFGLHDPGNDIAWPAVYVLGRDGAVAWRAFHDSYKTRPPISEILTAVDAAARQPTGK